MIGGDNTGTNPDRNVFANNNSFGLLIHGADDDDDPGQLLRRQTRRLDPGGNAVNIRIGANTNPTRMTWRRATTSAAR